MKHVALRLTAASLAASVTVGILAGIAMLARVESSGVAVLVLPDVVVTASKSTVAADACRASPDGLPAPCDTDLQSRAESEIAAASAALVDAAPARAVFDRSR